MFCLFFWQLVLCLDMQAQLAGENKSPTLSPAAETVPQPFSGIGPFENAEGVRVQAARFGKKFIAAARHTAAHTWKAGLFVLLVSFVLIQSKFVRSSFQGLEG
jgi:hypothetical protein